jgi:DHA1 family bicyclomycin/chloramphenicol resistance-like MFS transporter
MVGALVASAWGWRADFLALAVAGGILLVVFGVAVPETLPTNDRSAGAGAGAGLRSALRNRELVVVALSLAAFAFGFYAYIGTASFIVERELGFSPAVFAIVFAANAAAMVCANLVCRRVVRRHPPRRLLGAGLVGSCTGGLLLVAAAAIGAPAWTLWAGSMVFAASAGFVLPSAHAAGQATVVVSGAASAITGAAQFLSGVLGSPATGVLGVSAGTLGAVILASSGVGVGMGWAGLGRRPSSPRST